MHQATTLERARLDAKVNAENMTLQADAALKRIPEVSARAAEEAREREASLSDIVTQKELATLRVTPADPTTLVTLCWARETRGRVS